MEHYLSRANIGTTEKNLFRKLLVFPGGNPSELHTVCCVSKKKTPKKPNNQGYVYIMLFLKKFQAQDVGEKGRVSSLDHLFGTSLASFASLASPADPYGKCIWNV